jgi:hypothetical protein
MSANYGLRLSARSQRLLLLVFLLAILVLRGHGVFQEWTQAKGWEYEWVAGPLASGHGYSFETAKAWLVSYARASDYSPTAWVEPLHTAIMAASFRLFREHGRLVLVLMNFFWVATACWVVFLLVERLQGFMAGAAAATLFALLPFGRADLLLYIGNGAIASCLFVVCGFLLTRCLERLSLARSLALGATIGIANLTHAGSLLFGPLSAFLILAGSRSSKLEAWKSAGVVLLTPVLMVAPWMLRNYLTFDQWVIVRNGFGFQLYIGNPALAQTFVAGLPIEGTATEPPWTAAGPRQALATLRDLEHDRGLRSHSRDTIEAHAPKGYELYNEAQRDRVFFSRAVTFMRDRPLLTAEMTFWKAYAFFANWGLVRSLIAAAAFLGWLAMMRDIRATSLALLVVGYTFPYALSLPIYYRYRAPVEPVMFVLIGLLLGTVGKQLRRWSSVGCEEKLGSQSVA